MLIYPNVNAHVVITHFTCTVLSKCVLHTNSDLKNHSVSLNMPQFFVLYQKKGREMILYFEAHFFFFVILRLNLYDIRFNVGKYTMCSVEYTIIVWIEKISNYAFLSSAKKRD